MRTSQNGWTVITRDRCVSIQVPGGTIPVRAGDVAVVLRWAVCRWHLEVEPLLWPGCWGWADRPVRGGTATSNHASGTAVDLSAPLHPLGKRGTFTARQRKTIRRIIADSRGALRWGGDYVGRADEMHIEIVGTPEQVARLAQRIRDQEDDVSQQDVEKALKDGRLVRNRSWKPGQPEADRELSVVTVLSQLEDDGDALRRGSADHAAELARVRADLGRLSRAVVEMSETLVAIQRRLP